MAVNLDKTPRGMTKATEVTTASVNRDVSSLVTQIVRGLANRNVLGTLLMVLAFCVIMWPGARDLFLLSAAGLTAWGMRRTEDIPLRIPIHARLSDPTEGGRMGEGIFCPGYDRFSGGEIWITNSDCRTHMLVMGTTGSGKSELLIDFAANALTWSSGLLFCDGKGDVGVFAKMYALARKFGREDDLLVLNFMTGNSDVGSSGGKILSNTLNPFATGSSDALTQMVVQLMDDAGGDGAMWKGRATAMFTAIMRALTWMRAEEMVDLNVGTIRDHLNLKSIVDLAYSDTYADMPISHRKSLKSYLTSLPGFKEEKLHNQAQTTLDQHGYLDMQFTKILGNLADVYGHIFFTPYGEIDMSDVVINRRILFIMLPALEKSGDEIANLGKIVVAMLKGMMGMSLGSQIEGTWEDVVDNRVTNSETPFLVILDEAGYYTVQGMALMCAQARSLGFSMVIATQDLPAMRRIEEKEADSIIGNTRFKYIMAVQEPKETMELAIQTAGKGLTTRMSGYSGVVGNVQNGYRDNREARYEEIDRVDSRDIRRQGPGEYILLTGDEVIYGKSLYTNPEKSLDRHKLRLGANHFLRIAKYNLREMECEENLPSILKVLVSREAAAEIAKEGQALLDSMDQRAEDREEIPVFSRSFLAFSGSGGSTQAACAAVANLSRVIAGFGDNVGIRKGTALSDIQPTNSEVDDLDEEDYAAAAAAGAYSDEDMEAIGDALEQRHDQADWNSSAKFLEPEPEIPVQQRKRTAAKVDAKVGHGIQLGGKDVSDVARDPVFNDSIVRSVAELNFDPENETMESVDARLEHLIGAPDDPDFERVASSDELDRVIKESESVRLPMDEDDVSNSMLTDFLDQLMDQTDE